MNNLIKSTPVKMKAASATLFFIVLYLKYYVPNNIIMRLIYQNITKNMRKR